MQMNGILDTLIGNTSAQATQSAIATAAATPFSVTLSVDSDTRDWIAMLLVAGVGLSVLAFYLKKQKL